MQTTLVPHANVCTYVCGHTRVFSVGAPDPVHYPRSPPSSSSSSYSRRIVVALVVVPLLIIRMMGRHTLELKLRDVSSVGELRASTTPRSCRLLDVRRRSYQRGVALYIRGFVERDCENTWRIIPPRKSARSERFYVRFRIREFEEVVADH